MKKLYTVCLLALITGALTAQPTQTIAIQFYVDGNNDCNYNTGEQLYYNVPGQLLYVPTNPTIFPNGMGTVPITGSFTACGPTTLYVWAAATPAANTLVPAPGSGVVPNLSCGNYTNIPYNSNNIIYLPVTLTGTSNVGVASQVAIWPNMSVSSGTTPALCANGADSIYFTYQVSNLWNCSGSNTMSTRTYSLFFDGNQFESFTFNTAVNSWSASGGQNTNSYFTEIYGAGTTNLYLSLDLPASYSVIGSHTFAIKSSQVYNDPTSVVDWDVVFNSVPCNNISGKFFADCNSNCVFDGNDSYGVGWAAEGLVYNTANNFSLTFHPGYHGSFSLFLPASMGYTLTQYSNPSYTAGSGPSFTACSNATIAIPSGANTNTFSFGYMTSFSGVTDPWGYFFRTSSTSPSVSPNVGIVFGIYLGNAWYNLCSTTGSNPGTLKMILPKFINYVSTQSGPTPTVVAGSTSDTLIYPVSNFTNWTGTPFASFSVVVSPTAVPGTTFNITSHIFPTVDINLNNNTYTWKRTIGGPFDPNGKYAEAPGMLSNGDIPLGTDKLVYDIGFQNVGNAPAFNVVTLDTIDANLDLTSIQVLQSSYPVSLQVDHHARVVAFHFNGINLPDHVTDEPGSHGFVQYSIKLKPGLPVNTVIKNRAHNYFDFMEPVATNQTSNKLVKVSGIGENDASFMLEAMPNPVNDRLTLKAGLAISHVSVYSLTGRLLIEVKSHSANEFVDMAGLGAGIYLVKVELANGAHKTIKVVKE